MDNRKDLTEDLQSTPEHPAAQGAGGGTFDPRAAQQPGQPVGASPTQPSSGLTAGPHNEVPQGPGFESSYRPNTEPSQAMEDTPDNSTGDRADVNPRAANEDVAGRLTPVRKAVTRGPLPWIISAAGLTMCLLALRRARNR